MNGILLINKEANMTSHDVVFKLRKILKTKKIGHTGTLDPDATGVLVLLVNNACKALPFLEDTDKEYIAECRFGQATDTEDIWGKIIEEKAFVPIPDFKALTQKFIGQQKQLPPMVSSIKVNGRKLYEYARANEEVERPLRDINIYDIEVLDEAKYQFKVHCSSGTYIRSLCRDMALLSDNVGCLSSLIRSKVGRFELKDCVSLSDVEAGNYKIFPLLEALAHFQQIELSDPKDVLSGKRVQIETSDDRVLFTYNNEAFAIYEREKGNSFRSVRGLW